MMTALVIGVWAAVVLLVIVVQFLNSMIYRWDEWQRRQPKP